MCKVPGGPLVFRLINNHYDTSSALAGSSLMAQFVAIDTGLYLANKLEDQIIFIILKPLLQVPIKLR